MASNQLVTSSSSASAPAPSPMVTVTASTSSSSVFSKTGTVISSGKADIPTNQGFVIPSNLTPRLIAMPVRPGGPISDLPLSEPLSTYTTSSARSSTAPTASPASEVSSKASHMPSSNPPTFIPAPIPTMMPSCRLTRMSPGAGLPGSTKKTLELNKSDFDNVRKNQEKETVELSWQRMLNRVQMSALSQKRMVNRDHPYKPWIMMQRETVDLIKAYKEMLARVYNEREACIARLKIHEKEAFDLWASISMREEHSQHGKFILDMEKQRFEHIKSYTTSLEKHIAFLLDYIDQLSIRSDLISCPQCFKNQNNPEDDVIVLNN